MKRRQVVISFERFIQLGKTLDPQKEVKTIFEFGAYDGVHAKRLSGEFPGASVFTFECQPFAIERARKNLQGTHQVELVPLAVSDHDGEIPFFPVGEHDGGSSSVFQATGGYEKDIIRQTETRVACTRVDSWASQRGVVDVDLIHADIQGAELAAFRGMGGLFDTVQLVHTEILFDQLYAGAGRFQELHDFLTQKGMCLIYMDALSRPPRFPGWGWSDALYQRIR